MSDKQINAVSRVDMDGSSRLAQVAAQAQEASQKQTASRRAEAAKQEDIILDQVSQKLSQTLTPVNTSLKFQIDDETNEITVLIVDRATDKVLHTIPAEAIKNLPAGNLMQYFA
jgi:uncharacterized FlaG/YvyC family protein